MLHIESQVSKYQSDLEFVIAKNLTSCHPSEKINIANWRILKTLELADPQFNVPAPVDLIIGGEIFAELLSNGQLQMGKGLPSLQLTVFGWVVMGKVEGKYNDQPFTGISLSEGEKINS